MPKQYNITSESLKNSIIQQYGEGPYDDINAQEIQRFQNIVVTADTGVSPEPVDGFLRRLIDEKTDLGERLDSLEKFLKKDDGDGWFDFRSPEELAEDGVSPRQADLLRTQYGQMKDLYRTMCHRLGDLTK